MEGPCRKTKIFILLNAFAFFHLQEKNMRHIFAGVTETQTPIHDGRRR